MTDMLLNELEVAPPAVVKQSARDFAAALAETPQFKAFEEATLRLHGDPDAQRAMDAYQSKHQSLQMMLMLNAVSDADKAELQRLHREFVTQPSIAAYAQAQADLMAVCQAAADWLSEAIGLNFAAVCGPGCC